MEMTFRKKYKPKLGGGEENRIEIYNHTIPEDLATQIRDKTLLHFDKVVKWSLSFLEDWSKRTGFAIKVSCYYHWVTIC